MARLISILALLVVIASSSGCTRKENCVNVTEHAWFTEVDIQEIPIKINYSGEFKDVKIKKNVIEVPLGYTSKWVEAGVGRFIEINETEGYQDYARKDEIVTAHASVQVNNVDDEGGNFTVNWSYSMDKWMVEKRQEAFVGAKESRVFRLEFNITRGDDWNYSYTIIPGVKEIHLPYVAFETINESGEKVIFRQNRTYRNILRNVTRRVCS